MERVERKMYDRKDIYLEGFELEEDRFEEWFDALLQMLPQDFEQEVFYRAKDYLKDAYLDTVFGEDTYE
jgi:hypothetical protein